MSKATAQELGKAKEMMQVFDRCNVDDPSEQDVTAMRGLLKEAPDLWRVVGDMCGVVTRNVIGEMRATPAVKESVLAGREAMRQGLGYEASPLLEQMLIDHLLLCWVRLQLAEHTYTGCIKEGGTLNQGIFWEKRLSAVQRRYLRAVETLARIRRMDLPTIQINVADQQVNIA
jgi:hypothetical protein